MKTGVKNIWIMCKIKKGFKIQLLSGYLKLQEKNWSLFTIDVDVALLL